jgi:hypothetical protein
MMTLVFLLEEPSAQDALEGVLPRIIPAHVRLEYLVFEGKQDLEKRMARRIRGWLGEHSMFVVLRDQDSGNCRVIKQRLADRCGEGGRPDSLVRIACHELESWFVGDWQAVGEAFALPNLHKQSAKALYRNPDKIGSPVTELRKFIPTYQKRDGARRIGPHLLIERNRSRSFQVFVQGLQKLLTQEGVA